MKAMRASCSLFSSDDDESGVWVEGIPQEPSSHNRMSFTFLYHIGGGDKIYISLWTQIQFLGIVSFHFFLSII